MIPHARLTRTGVLPLRTVPIRFAVGAPDGLTSNSWRLWTTRPGDVYLACCDNFKEAKVSLHASGRWRMGFTTEALGKNASLVPCDEDRSWEVWDQPPAVLPQTVIAFRLLFLTSELAVRPEQRTPRKWARVIYIEAGPPGKLTVLTVFVTTGDALLKHESQPSFRLASLDIGSGRRVQLVAHGEAEAGLPDLIGRAVADARVQVESAAVKIPAGAYGYFFGRRDDGSRFLVPARFDRNMQGAG